MYLVETSVSYTGTSIVKLSKENLLNSSLLFLRLMITLVDHEIEQFHGAFLILPPENLALI